MAPAGSVSMLYSSYLQSSLGAAELLGRLAGDITLQVVTDLHKTCNTEAMWTPALSQELQSAKYERNSVVKLPLPLADYKNPLGMCQ